MSKSNQNKLKPVKENDIKYNLGKDIDVINPTYSRQKTIVETKKNQPKALSKRFTKQEGQINIKIKEQIEEDFEKEPEKEPEKEEEKLIEKNIKRIANENNNNLNNNINQYIQKIKELEEQIKKINIEYSIEIESKEKDIKKLVNTNQSLKNSLEILTQRLDNLLFNKNNEKLKKVNKEDENNKEDLKYQLEIKEKELKNQQQLINILKKDNKNIRNILNKLGYNENNINLIEKINQQYKEIINLQRNFKEYKDKHSSCTININSKKINSLNEDSTHKKKNKKVALNSMPQTKRNNNTAKNKSQSLDNIIKKHEYHGISSSFNYNKDNSNPESVFTEEEQKLIKNYFKDDEKYKNFINKISILEKSSIVKEKEMNMKIKIIENKLKVKDNELEFFKKETKEKDNIIIGLNLQNKELKKTANELMNKINLLTKTINELDQKNQLILKKNEQIKNTIFSIDGIIEAKSKEGNDIPIIKEANTNSDSNKMEETNHSRNTNKEEKNNNSFNITNSNY